MEEYCRVAQAAAISFHLPLRSLPAILPSFVKSAVAAGAVFAQNALPVVSISCRKGGEAAAEENKPKRGRVVVVGGPGVGG